MLKTCIKKRLFIFALSGLLLTGCGAFSGTTQPDVPDKVKHAYTKALKTMRAGKHKSAIRQFKQIAKLQPSIAGPHTNLGMIYLKLNSLENAQSSLQKAIELNPQNTIAYNYLGIVYRTQGRFDEAEQAYLKAIEIDSNYDFAHLNLGILYDLYKTDSQRAIRHYQQYLETSDKPDKLVEKWIIDIQRRNTARQDAKENQG